MTQQQFKVNLKLKLIKASFLLNVGDDFADPSKQAFKKPTKDSTPSWFTICTISSEFNFMIFIYVGVQFYPWFHFNFPLFLGMVMYGNETKDKIEPQHFHQNDVGKLGRGWRRKVSSIYSNSCPNRLFLLFFWTRTYSCIQKLVEFFKVRVQNLGGGGEGLVSSKSMILYHHVLNFQHDTSTLDDMSGKAARKTQVTIKTFTETGHCTWKASGTQGKVATSYNLKISQLAGVVSPLCFKPLVSHPWLNNLFSVQSFSGSK